MKASAGGGVEGGRREGEEASSLLPSYSSLQINGQHKTLSDNVRSCKQ